MLRTANGLASLLIVLLAAAGLAAAGAFLYLQHTLRGTLEQAVGERLGTDASVGFARIGLFPPGIHLASIAIRNPDGFRDRYFLKTRALRLEIEDYDSETRLVTSPRLSIRDMEVWIERRGRRSNSRVIEGNLARFERKHRITRADKTKFIIRELRIRNIEAQLRAGSDSTTSEVPEIVLRNVGAGRGGVTLGELADIVTRATLRAVLKNEIERKLDRRKQEEKQELGQKLERLFD